MEKIIMIVGRSKDLYGAYSDNCDGIYASGESLEAVKSDTYAAIEGIKKNLPRERWPKQIRGDFEIEWQLDVPSFLEYYSNYMSLAGMERATGITRRQLSNYMNHRTVPHRKQRERIMRGIHHFASELITITL